MKYFALIITDLTECVQDHIILPSAETIWDSIFQKVSEEFNDVKNKCIFGYNISYLMEEYVEPALKKKNDRSKQKLLAEAVILNIIKDASDTSIVNIIEFDPIESELIIHDHHLLDTIDWHILGGEAIFDDEKGV